MAATVGRRWPVPSNLLSAGRFVPGGGGARSELTAADSGSPESEADNKGSVAYLKIKKLVSNYRFRPLEPIQVNKLSDILGLSITPVREALFRLCGEKLVEVYPRHGFFLKPLDLRELYELHDLASLLLEHSIQLARTPRRGVLPGRCPTQESKTGDGQATEFAQPEIQADLIASYIEQAYKCIVQTSSNLVMTALIANFNDRTHYVRTIWVGDPAGAIVARQHVSELVSAVRNYGGETAKAALRQHFDAVQESFPNLVKEGLARAYSCPPCY
jgi:DNA-binding GntR family transcriptional regulator